MSSRSLLFVIPLVLTSCAPQTSAPSTKPSAKVVDDHGHDHGHDHDSGHDRTGFMMQHAGKYHFLMQAHLSEKEGNELDLFVELMNEQKPTAIPYTKFKAKAKRIADEKEFELEFQAAPANERPKDEPEGSCSHFVAKADWLKPDDKITIYLELELNGRVSKPVWRNFVPKNFVHTH